MPYAAGVSVASCSSMYSRYCLYEMPDEGGSNLGKSCSESSSSSLR